MYRLQFHRLISECFASNFILFLNERDGLSKWELFFSREHFLRIVKKPRKSQNLNPEKISATRYVSTCDVSGFFDSLLRD